MKRLLILIFASPFITFAQHYTPWEFHYYDLTFKSTIYNGDYLLDQAVLDTDANQIIRTVKTGRKSYQTTFFLNDKHRVQRIEHPNGVTQYSYEKDTLLRAVQIEGKKGVRYFNMEYREGQRVLTQEFYKNELVSLRTNNFDSDGRLIHASLDYPKKRKSTSIFREYAGDELKRTQHYKNGKVIRVLDYTCKPEGENQAVAATSTVCNYREESNDGSFIVYTKNERKKGVILIKQYYSADSTLFRVETLKNDSVVLSRQDIDGYNNTLVYYKEDGSVRSKRVKTFENNINTSLTYNARGKITRMEEIVLGENNQILERKSSHNGSKRQLYTSQYTYDSEDRLISEKRLKRDKLLWEKEYSYVN